MNQSYWEQKYFYRHRDLIICGAGFTGLSAAIYYRKKFPDRKVLILEKDVVCGGASTKNAGFACFGSPTEILADLQVSPEEEVFQLVEKRWRGLHNLRSLLGDEKTGYQHHHGYELFRPEDDAQFEKCMQHLEYLNDKLQAITGKKVYQSADEKLKYFGFRNMSHLLENIEEGQVDTGKMYFSLLQLAREHGVEILNGIRVNSYEEKGDVEIRTDHGNMSCGQFLIANNGFASQIIPNSKTKPARAQVLITTPIKNLKIEGTFNMDEGFYYFRNIDKRILFGGGRNLDFELETTTELELNNHIQQHLEKVLKENILPDTEYQIANRWSGIMGVGTEKKVIVKQLSEKIFCAIRLSGMGLALSTLLGKEVAEMMR